MPNLMTRDPTPVPRGMISPGNVRMSSRAVVTVVQTAQSRLRNDATGCCGADSAARCFFMQPEMGAVVIIVRDILRQKPPEMSLVQGDDVVEQLATAAANPAFRNSVLPRALDGGLNSSDFHGPNRNRNFQSVSCVMIEEKKLRRRLVGKRFPQLLHNPGAGRMAGDIEVQDAPAVMANNEEAVENTESDRRDREEVHRRNRLAMILQEGQPAPRRLGISGGALHPTGDGSLRDLEAQHEKFAVDAGSTPSRVLVDHAEDQGPDLFRELFSTNLLSHFREEAPVHAEASPVPTDHGLRGDDNKRSLPGGPKPASEHPEEFVERAELGPGMLALQYGELLPKRQILQEQGSA